MGVKLQVCTVSLCWIAKGETSPYNKEDVIFKCWWVFTPHDLHQDRGCEIKMCCGFFFFKRMSVLVAGSHFNHCCFITLQCCSPCSRSLMQRHISQTGLSSYLSLNGILQSLVLIWTINRKQINLTNYVWKKGCNWVF